MRSRGKLGLLGLALLLAPACGKRGLPLPPEPRGPFPVRGLQVRQVGDRIEARFLIAPPRGAKPAQQPVRVELVRVRFGPGTSPPPDPGTFRRRGLVVASEEGDPLSAAREFLLSDDEAGVTADGPTLRYAVRVRDRRGRVSPLVSAPDLVPLPAVEAPRRVEAQPTADGIRLTWEPPPGAEAAQYNVYRAQDDEPPPRAPRNKQPLTVASFLDSDIAQGEAYRYIVRVLLAEGEPFREGRPSSSVRVVAVDRYAPAAPERLVVVQEGRAVRLFWDPNREPDLAGYRVYRSVEGGPWAPIGPDLLEQASYLDGDVQFEQRVGYRVTALDRASPPNESPPCTPQELELRPEPPGSEEPQ